MEFWATLGIPPSRDERDIKRAYARQLKQIDQSTEIEAFDRLQQAYQDALEFCRYGDTQPNDLPDDPPSPADLSTAVDEEAHDDETPVDPEVQAAYDGFQSIFSDPDKRSDAAQWQDWLKQDWRRNLDALQLLSHAIFGDLAHFFVNATFTDLRHAIPPEPLVALDQTFEWRKNELSLGNDYTNYAINAVFTQLRMCERLTEATESIPERQDTAEPSDANIRLPHSNELATGDIVAEKLAETSERKARAAVPGGFWRRTLAATVDIALVFFAFIAIETARNIEPDTSNILWKIAILFFLYQMIFEVTPLRATPGKLIFRLKVAKLSESGEEIGAPDLLRLFFRNLIKAFILLRYGLAILCPLCLVQAEKKMVHDLLCQVDVIQRARKKKPAPT